MKKIKKLMHFSALAFIVYCSVVFFGCGYLFECSS